MIIGVLALFVSCLNIEKPQKLNSKDTSQVLKLALNHEEFYKDFKQLNPHSHTIYIFIKNENEGKGWPTKIDKFDLLLTQKNIKHRDWNEYLKDRRFIIAPPKMELKSDTMFLSLYSYRINVEYLYKFVKSDDQWKIVYTNQIME